jgi:hypothetical protein
VRDDRTFAFVIGAVVAVAVIWAGVAVIASVTDVEGDTARRAGFALLAALAVVLVVGGAIAVGVSSGDRAFAYLIGAVLAVGVIWAVIAVIAKVADLESGAAERVGFGLLAGLGIPVLVGIVVLAHNDDRAFGYFLTALWVAGLAWALVAVFSSVDDVDPAVAQRIGYGLLFGVPLLVGGILAVNRDAKEERLAEADRD